MKALRYMTMAALTLAMTSCVFKNEMAYPRIFAEILDFKVENEAQPTEIDSKTMTVNVVLDETADIKAVPVLSYTYTEGATSTELGDVIDMTDTIDVTLSNYHDYNWKIIGRQPVERFVNCSDIVKIDWMPEDCSATVYLLKTADITALTIDSMKLGLKGSEIISTKGLNGGEVISENCSFPMTLDCSRKREFTVRHKGEETVWSLEFVYNNAEPKITRISPWCYHVLVEAEFDGVGEVTAQYRKKGTEEWTVVKELTIGGLHASKDITGLEENTEYELMIVHGNKPSKISTFKTYASLQLDNMDFEKWNKDGKVWNPYISKKPDKSDIVWDSANKGATSAPFGLGRNTTTPDEHCVEGKYSARMETISVFGSMAAGNLFTGRFDVFKDLKAYLFWGTPYTSRPYSLKGYYDYSPAKITAPEKLILADNIPNPYHDMNGKTDKLQILVALIAEEEEPLYDSEGKQIKSGFAVASNKPGSPDLRNDPRVIAFGELLSDENTEGQFKEFELKFDYKENDDRIPSYAIVVACASGYGNFFTGGIGSVLYVDDFKFTFR